MRISSELAKAINDQISYESTATHAYVAIGSWCERIGYSGSATFFFEQAAEENTHMLKFVHYLNTAGAEAIIPATEKPQSNFDSIRNINLHLMDMYWRYLNENTNHVCNICSYLKSCRPEITDAFVVTEAEAKEALPEQEIATSVMK